MTDSDERLRRLYGTLPREEPPPALDAAVLAASRRALAAPSLARRWGIPLSVAAAAVLAIGLALQMRGHEDAGERAPPASMRTDEFAPRAKSAAEPGRPEAKREAPAAPAAPPFAPRREAGPNPDAARAQPGPAPSAAPDARGLGQANPGGAPVATGIGAPATIGPFSAPQSPLQVMEATSRGAFAKTLPIPPNAPGGTPAGR
jgi:hypothetical protein